MSGKDMVSRYMSMSRIALDYPDITCIMFDELGDCIHNADVFIKATNREDRENVKLAPMCFAHGNQFFKRASAKMNREVKQIIRKREKVKKGSKTMKSRRDSRTPSAKHRGKKDGD
jgi:hypothetical protein